MADSWSIYVIGTLAGPKKIGVSRNPTGRVFALSNGAPAAYEILFSIPAADRTEAFGVEEIAHRLLRTDRLRGEWFNVSADEAIQAVQRAVAHVRHEEPILDLSPLDGSPRVARPTPSRTILNSGKVRGHAQLKGGNLLTRYKLHQDRSPECVAAYREYMRAAQRRYRARRSFKPREPDGLVNGHIEEVIEQPLADVKPKPEDRREGRVA